MKFYQTSRCLLRVVELVDAPLILNNFSDPKLMAHYDMRVVHTLHAAEQMLSGWINEFATRRRRRWTIILREENVAIGTCGLHSINRERGCAELGYEISREYWGKGILSEVFPVLLGDAFEELELHRLTARVSPRNVASVALLKKFGFRHRVVPQVAGWLRGASFSRRILRLTRCDYLQQSNAIGSMTRSLPETGRTKTASTQGLQDSAAARPQPYVIRRPWLGTDIASDSAHAPE